MLTPAATISYAAKGTVLHEGISLGSIRYGQEEAPPAEVLAACEQNNGTAIGASAFVPGTLTVTYPGGTLPVTAFVELGQDHNVLKNVVGSLEPGEHEPTGSLLVLNHDGTWDCHGDSEGHAAFSLQPHQSTTDEIWILMLGARSNEHPTLPQSTLDLLGLDLRLQSESLGTTPTIVFSGPRAANCEAPEEHSTTHTVLPFARLPHAAHFATGGTLVCRADGRSS